MSNREIRRRIERSQKQERDGMKRVGGRTHPGSGSSKYRKADGRTDATRWFSPVHALHEFKRTDKKQITLKASDLEKLFNEALVENRFAHFRIELNGRSYVLFEEHEYDEMMHYMRERDD